MTDKAEQQFDDETRVWASANGVTLDTLLTRGSLRAINTLLREGYIVENDGIFHRRGKRLGDLPTESCREH